MFAKIKSGILGILFTASLILLLLIGPILVIIGISIVAGLFFYYGREEG